MYVKKEFSVKERKTEVVTAALPMQEQWLPLSNLDLLLPPVDFSVFFCYLKPEWLSFSSVVGVLKKSLAETLVSYSPFAGELVKKATGELGILCNNGGVDFVEAFGNVELKDLDFYNPDQSVQGKLVPERKRGILAVQATQLECGGVVVAFTFSHQAADAYSANMFLVSLAEIVQSKPISHSPIFCRSLLFPRKPGGYDISVDKMYVPVSAISPPAEDKIEELEKDQVAISRIYYIKSDQVNELQTLANIGNYPSGKEKRRTKLEAFSAFLWKTISVGVSVSAGDGNSCRLGIVVDGRSRLIDGEDKQKAELIASYLGNVVSIPYGEKRIEELREKPLNWVANEVHDFLQSAVTQEHFLGLIDWVEEHRPEPVLAKIYTDREPAVVVSSGQQFRVRKMDFGWGLPAFGSYHFPWGGKSGYVMPMPSPKGNGDWIVYMHLLKDQLEIIETNASQVFRTLTYDYLVS